MLYLNIIKMLAKNKLWFNLDYNIMMKLCKSSMFYASEVKKAASQIVTWAAKQKFAKS